MKHPFLSAILMAVLSLISYTSHCQAVSEIEAKAAALTFINHRPGPANGTLQPGYSIHRVDSEKSTHTLLYICELLPEGFVVVSGDKRVQPVLAYSYSGKFDRNGFYPKGIQEWMKYYLDQIDYAIETMNPLNPELSAKWAQQSGKPYSKAPMNSVAPLLYSTWNQGTPYNTWCPADPAGPGGHCYAGCVATAMGQLLYYYQFPDTGEGEYSYSHPQYGTIAAQFDTTHYQWEKMPSNITKVCDEISKLLFHQGVSVDMDYGPNGSGMWNHKAAYSLRTYFRMGPETVYYFRDSVDLDWDSLLITNLDQGKPLYYAGWAGVQSQDGHAFVCDGYEPGNYYHFNWGWGGSYNGYFYTNNLTPGGTNFNFAQEVIPTFPDTVNNQYPLAHNGLSILHQRNGGIEDGSGWYPYGPNLGLDWLIDPQYGDLDSVKQIKITFNMLDLGAGDTLFVYSGSNTSAPLFGKYYGQMSPGQIVVVSNKTYLHFASDGQSSGRGWHLDYEAVEPAYCASSTTFTAQSGSISDGSGSYRYVNNTLCHWKITPATNMPVTLVFTHFALSDTNDFVKVTDIQNPSINYIYTGTEIPTPVTIPSGKVYITFLSNGAITDQGWDLEYFASQTGTPDDPQGGIKIYPNPASNLLHVEVASAKTDEMEWSLYTLQGRLVKQGNLKLTVGLNAFSTDISKIPSADYFLVVRNCEKSFRYKVLILN